MMEEATTPEESEEPGESMESLLAEQAAVSEKLAGKQVAWVKVVQVTKEQVLVDIGEKHEGMIPLAEFGPGGEPAVGQRIPVVRAGSRRDGSVTLSYKRAKAELGWELAVKAHAEKARVRGRVLSSIKGGFLVDVGGVSGFLPASLADLRPVRDPKRMVGTGVRCYIVELNESKRQVVLSRKAVLEEETAKRREKLLAELRVGEVRIGRVVQVGPGGLVIDIGGAEGLVRPGDIAWGAVKPPTQQRGDKLRVKILAKSEGDNPLALGLKQLVANPADAIRKKFPPKTIVSGKVTEAGPAGVRFEIADKRVAFCPAAEADPGGSYKAGEEVSAVVQGVDPDTFEVIVSINKHGEIKDRKRLAQYLKAPPPLTLGQLLSPEKENP